MMEIAHRAAVILEDEYGEMPPRHVLELSYGRIGGVIADLVDIARSEEHRDDGQCHPGCWDLAVAEANAAIPWFTYDIDRNEYTPMTPPAVAEWVRIRNLADALDE